MARSDLGHYPPQPLTRWQSAWRYAVALLPAGSIVLAWVLIGLLPPQSRDEFAAWREQPLYLARDLGLGAIAFGAMHWRRRRPVAAGIVSGLCQLGSVAASGPAAVCLMSVATRRRWPAILTVSTTSIVPALLSAFFPMDVVPTGRPQGIFGAIVSVLMIVAMALLGLYIGVRRDLFASLKDRAETAEREQALRVDQARITERTRIAREMHDVMAHRVSLVSMHAGALAYREDLSPDETRAAAAVIQQNAHQALTDLRTVLGTLRDGASAAAPPQPTLAALDGLVTEARAAGQRIDLQWESEQDAIPERISRDAFRVVQEGLTNARKHAPGSTVRLLIELLDGQQDGQPSMVHVMVSNPRPLTSAAGAGARLGLVGLRERVELTGGRLQYQVSATGNIELEAWLPC